jgi:hypothetical protein
MNRQKSASPRPSLIRFPLLFISLALTGVTGYSQTCQWLKQSKGNNADYTV